MANSQLISAANAFSSDFFAFLFVEARKVENIQTNGIFCYVSQPSSAKLTFFLFCSQQLYVMESIISHEIISFCLQNGLISDCQYAYMKNRSTVTQLIACYDDFTRAVDSENCVDVIYLDIQKAFNTVSHDKLMVKLISIGISDPLLAWIKAFLSDRTQRVGVNGTFSDWVEIRRGVPQGSVLGPILFILFMNDLIDEVQYSTIKLYADDCKLYLAFPKGGNPINLKADLKAVDDWTSRWQLKLAYEKCHSFHIGHGNPSSEYSLGDVTLPSVSSVKDLGVTFSRDLKFSQHCGTIAKKAFYLSNLIYRNFICRDPKFLADMAIIYVIPHLEYACEVWNPYLVHDIKLLESVLRAHTRRIPTLRTLSYKDRLATLNLQSLEVRRIIRDLTMVYRILHGLTSLEPDSLFIMLPHSRTRGHSFKLTHVYSRLDCRKHSFSIRSIAPWNSLPQRWVEAKNAPTFQKMLSESPHLLYDFCPHTSSLE